MAGALMSRGGGRGGRRAKARPVSDINVTPLVDVMLVLLIIFMVTAPLLSVGVPVDLPKTSAPTVNEQEKPLVVSVRADGSIYLEETLVTEENLGPRLQAIHMEKPDQRIFVRGDKGLQYGRVMEVMGLVADAGFDKVALVAEMPDGGSKKK